MRKERTGRLGAVFSSEELPDYNWRQDYWEWADRYDNPPTGVHYPVPRPPDPARAFPRPPRKKLPPLPPPPPPPPQQSAKPPAADSSDGRLRPRLPKTAYESEEREERDNEFDSTHFIADMPGWPFTYELSNQIRLNNAAHEYMLHVLDQIPEPELEEIPINTQRSYVRSRKTHQHD